ncbi:hypothetical protein ACFE04_027842 [Oxalis oulophora]
MGSHAEQKLRFCIDRGGTFTDVYAELPGQPDGRVMKLLSVDPSNYDDAPIEGIRRILEEYTGHKIPRTSKIPTNKIEWIRMGTTVATNALLERKGERIALCVTKGFRDLLQIGNQARPNIFDLTVSKPSNLYEEVIQVEERVELVKEEEARDNSESIVKGVSGELVRILEPINENSLKPLLKGLLEKGISCLAVVLMHSYTYPQHEMALEKLASSMGFRHVSLSSALTPMVRAVPRGLTASVDAYLTPVIKEYLSGFISQFDEGLGKINVLFMQSDGGLAPESRFSGHKAVLSGPAGGVVGYSQTLFPLETEKPLIGFDMGGTSTDVSRYAGSYEQVLETQIAGAIIQAPQLDINTVAAGGGSKLKFQFGAFRVGPESVGAHPGPVCYRKGGELAITDANLVLGFVIPDYFPSIFGPKENQPLDIEATIKEFEKLAIQVNSYRKSQDDSATDMSVEEIALGFVNVANETMCRPIRQLTEMKGHETKNHALACFGGAGPQHACAIARSLGMKEVFIHRFCGILSAYGMGLADVVEEAQEPYSAVYNTESILEASHREALLVNQVKQKLQEQGFKNITTDTFLNLRYEGTDTAIMVKRQITVDGSTCNYAAEFEKLFQQEYGFKLLNRNIIICDVRVRGVGVTNILKPQELNPTSCTPKVERHYKVYFENGWHDTPLYKLENLGYGHVLPGPAIIMNGNSTVIVEPNCRAIITKYGNIKIEIESSSTSSLKVEEEKVADVVQLSIFNNRFMGIAEQMGRTLQRTSISTNIKERLDFSCALFGPDGGLVANAPHVPVHLGAMSSTIRWQLNHWGRDLSEGDVLVTNHPSAGGSHLPDITVITPVFNNGKLVFFVASRGHHAEIGGITPGSMPPFSKSIFEEGAAIKAFKLVQKGIFQEEGIIKLLTESIHNVPGTRKLQDNLSDLRAQVAANQRGISLIKELIEHYGLETVQAYMSYVQLNAEQAVREMLKSVANKVLSHSVGKSIQNDLVTIEEEDYMDDGSVIHLKLTINGNKGEAIFDFSGTSTEVYGNWNAPEAVTAAAVIYCLRCLVDVDIPLNQGCLAPVKIHIPSGSFLSPSDKAAVVGGNVLTSQRITDVVLTAFQACACSQGCMNNLTFGDNTFGYYETIGGGSGAGPSWDGTSGVQCHMTNTRMTDPEIFEQRYPVLLHKFGLRENSGGAGVHRGGDGLVREIEFKRPIVVSILSERRVHAPRGLKGGSDGARGANYLITKDKRKVYLGGKNTVEVQAGEILQILTPGGGGFGSVSSDSMDHAELSTEQVLRRDIPWETYMTTKLISGTGLQLLRRYDKKPESNKAQLLDDVMVYRFSWADGPAYVHVFVSILRDIFKEETVEYILALIDEMLTAWHTKLININQNFVNFQIALESARPKSCNAVVSNGEASKSKKTVTAINDVLKGLVEWLCAQLKKPSHPSRGIPTAVNCLSAILKEPVVRSSFVQADGLKLLIPLITPASTQQSIQLLYETCLCVWLLSYYEPANEYLATSRCLPRLIEVVKSSTKEKVVRVIILTLRNLLPKGTFGAQMVEFGLLQIVQSLKSHAWSDEDLLEALNQLEDGLKDNIKKLSSFDKYKQEVLLGHLDWSPMHKDPFFWRENISSFEENDFQILRVLLTILDTSSDPRTLAVACYDLSQFIQTHPAGRIIVTDLKAKERVMKLMNHENAELTKNALLCIQRLFLGAKYASFLQA